MHKRGLILGFGILAAILGTAPSAWAGAAAEALQLKISGDRYLRAGDTAHAIAAYKDALKINQQSEATLFNLAVAFYQDKNADGAIAALEEVLKLNPRDVETHYNLGCLRLYQRKITEAKLHFDHARELSSLDPTFIPMIDQAMEFVHDLEKTDLTTQSLALFFAQLEQGFAPPPVVF